jgi:hypothetical protein
MKTIIPLLLLSMLTACSTTGQRTVQNPEGYRDQELILIQQAKLEKMERDMERREQELKYQHLKELTQMQVQKQAAQGHVSCKLLCF